MADANVHNIDGGGTAVPVNAGDAEEGEAGRFGPKDNAEVHEAMRIAFEKKEDLINKRKAVNAELKAIDEGIVARGLNKQAWQDAQRYYRMTEDQRSGYDDTYGITRNAFDLPIVSGDEADDDGDE